MAPAVPAATQQKRVAWTATGLLCLHLLAASVVLQLNIPSASAWALLQPFTLVVVLSAIVHLPKQARCSTEKGGCPTPAGCAVLAALILGACLTVAWTAQQLHRDKDEIQEGVQSKHGMLLAALVLQLLVLVVAVVLAIMTVPRAG